ncbi:MAG: 3-oxoacyl-[acyl-carrier-protein] reductase [Candidatus Omnitrophica bacterium]|nr:3-oxoacyl-[acyl-carrier-protein] reductase [Candidatus Omnitrophota bacterium]
MILKGKLSIVTGAAQGIGRKIAEKLAENGSDLMICDVNQEALKEACSELEKFNVKIMSSMINVIDHRGVQDLINKTLDKFKKIDILINNAGITRDKLLLRMSEVEWDSVLAINLKGAFNFIKAVTRPMLRQKDGVIINMASIIGIMGNAGQSNYSASKAGLIGLTKSVAKELGSKGIRVNAIAPGYIITKMTERLPEEVKEAMLKTIPLRRFGEAADIADLVLFLSSAQSKYITGQVIQVDGGMLM